MTPVPRHIGQPEVAALELEGEPFVIDAQAMQDSSLQIVYMYRIGHHVVAIVVGLADGDAALYAAPGQPHAEAAGMMVAAIVGLGQPALAVHRAAEFSTPD